MLSGLLLGLAAVVAGGVVLVRWGRVALHKVIWHLRDRLIVAYIFIAVIPIAVIVLAARWVAIDLGGQVAVYLVNTELERRVSRLEEVAKALVQVPESRRAAMLDQIGPLFESRFPGLRVQLLEGVGDMGPSGIVSRQELLYIRARAADKQKRVVLLAPLNRDALSSLAPGLGPVSIIGLATASPLKLHDSLADSAGVDLPPPDNRFDVEIRWASQIPVADFDDPSRTQRALLVVRSRVSALLRTLFDAASTGEADLRNDMILAGVLLLLAQVVSVYIGVSVTQAITLAFNGLYEGTQRVMRGDFSHRIKARGDDQIAEVTNSFNRMTGNIERLLDVAKEKERFEAELAVARQVQDQLFPRDVPALATLELRAVCHPARMVSGDYYDYQPLGGPKTALVLADVAGKGVSAALLMASLQACVRMQVHTLRTNPESEVSGTACNGSSTGGTAARHGHGTNAMTAIAVAASPATTHRVENVDAPGWPWLDALPLNSAARSSNATLKSAIVWKRRAGSLRRHRRIACSSSGGTVASTRLGAVGSSLRILASTESRDSPPKALRPVTIS